MITFIGMGVPSHASDDPPATPVTVATVEEAGRLGTNLDPVSYWGQTPFANLVDNASDWVRNGAGKSWGQGPVIRLTRDGWPSRLGRGQVATLVLTCCDYPAGDYTVTYRGSGSFDISGAVGGSQQFTDTDGSGQVTLDGSTMVLLNIRTTDPKDPIRDVEIRRVGDPVDAVFRPAWLTHLKPYQALRFMDWQRTNAHESLTPRDVTCARRVRPTSYSQGTIAGVSIERQVELANLLNADPWFTIPHLASRDWVRCAAEIVARDLEPGLTPRFEFSNETWNLQFRQTQDMKAEGIRRKLAPGNDVQALNMRAAERHNEVMGVISDVFAHADRPVIRVLAAQAAWTGPLIYRLQTPGTLDSTDEIAIAPYFGNGRNLYIAEQADIVAAQSFDDIAAEAIASLTAQLTPWISAHQSLAAEYGKPIVMYEGGQHLVGLASHTALKDNLIAVNRSPQMGDMYRAYLTMWNTMTGNALLMHFNDAGGYSVWGSWGALESAEDAHSPKYDALVDYASGPPVARIGVTRPSHQAGAEIVFDASSSWDSKDASLTYAWTLSDGTTATTPTVTRRPMTSGPLTATVTVTDSDLHSATSTVTIDVTENAPPNVVVRAPDQVQAPAVVRLSAGASRDPERGRLTYLWQFSDGTTATTPVVSRRVFDAGTLEAVVTVTDPAGMSSSQEVVVSVVGNQPPTVVLHAPQSVTQGQRARFTTRGSSDPDRQRLTYTWEFSDGVTATGPSVVRDFPEEGTVAVQVTATDPGGLSHTQSSTFPVIANRAPVADLQVTSDPVRPASVLFSAAGSSDPDDHTLSYRWEFSDGTRASGLRVRKYFRSAGLVEVTLTVRDQYGLESEARAQVDIPS